MTIDRAVQRGEKLTSKISDRHSDAKAHSSFTA